MPYFLRYLGVGFLLLLACGAALAQAPAIIEKKLLGYLDNMSKFGNYGGAFDEAKLTKNADEFRAALIAAAKRADSLKYSFPKLKGKMFIATSPDDRLRIYSWDLESGGTMHDFDNVYQYRGSSGKVFTWTPKRDAEGGAGSFYTEIFQVKTTGGTIYLPVSTAIASTSLALQQIQSMVIKGNALNANIKLLKTSSGVKNSISFEYDFFSVVDHLERPIKLFFWDDGRKSFRFPVVIEDKKTPQGRVTKKFITYKFDGKYFVKTA